MMSKVEATLMAFWLNVSNGFNAESEFGPRQVELFNICRDFFCRLALTQLKLAIFPTLSYTLLTTIVVS